MEVRKFVIILEEICMDGGRKMDPPGKRAAAVAVIKNPFAGEYVEDLTPLMDMGEELGGILGKMAVDALGISPENAEREMRILDIQNNPLSSIISSYLKGGN